MGGYSASASSLLQCWIVAILCHSQYSQYCGSILSIVVPFKVSVYIWNSAWDCTKSEQLILYFFMFIYRISGPHGCHSGRLIHFSRCNMCQEPESQKVEKKMKS